jgi:hypothetical protein
MSEAMQGFATLAITGGRYRSTPLTFPQVVAAV